MKLEYTKIDPTGNITVIVETSVPRESQKRVAEFIMANEPDAEQLGFLESPGRGEDTRLQMAGGEFCGNATLSAAALFLRRGGRKRRRVAVGISGSEKPVGVQAGVNEGDVFSGTVSMPLPEGVEERTFELDGEEYLLPVVSFPGISHVISDGKLTPGQAERAIKPWCSTLGAEALGIMLLDSKRSLLTPLVYVPSAGTLFWERSCASGTSAVGAWLSAKSGKAAKLSLCEPGGLLQVEAELSGATRVLRLTGRAKILETRVIELV